MVRKILNSNMKFLLLGQIQKPVKVILFKSKKLANDIGFWTVKIPRKASLRNLPEHHIIEAV
jgi:hypothetical protein